MKHQEHFKTLNLIYFALVAGQVLFALVIFFIKGETASEDLSPFNMIIPMASISTIGVSYFLYNKMKEAGRELEDVHAKLNHYRTINIVRFAMLEGGNLFAIVAVLLTSSTYFYLFFALGMVAFLLVRPSQEGFINDYNVSRSQLEN